MFSVKTIISVGIDDCLKMLAIPVSDDSYLHPFFEIAGGWDVLAAAHCYSAVFDWLLHINQSKSNESCIQFKACNGNSFRIIGQSSRIS